MTDIRAELKAFEERLVKLLKQRRFEVDSDMSDEEEQPRTVIPRTQLIDYIKRYTAQGVERERMRNALLQLDVPEEEVDAAFAIVEERPLPDPEKERWEERKPLLFTVGTVIVLSLIAVTLLLLLFPEARFVCEGPDCLAQVDERCSPRTVTLTHTEELRGAPMSLQLSGDIIGRSPGGCRMRVALTKLETPPALEEFAASLEGQRMECSVRDPETDSLATLLAQCQGELRDSIEQLT